jgi:hypothetical protein
MSANSLLVPLGADTLPEQPISQPSTNLHQPAPSALPTHPNLPDELTTASRLLAIQRPSAYLGPVRRWMEHSTHHSIAVNGYIDVEEMHWARLPLCAHKPSRIVCVVSMHAAQLVASASADSATLISAACASSNAMSAGETSYMMDAQSLLLLLLHRPCWPS